MAQRVVEARAHRSYRRAHRASNFVHVHVAVVTKNDRDALICVEVRERPVERVAVLDGAMGVMRGSPLSCRIQLVVASVPSAADPIAARVREDATEPGIETVGIAEARELTPSAGECIVGRIFGLLRVVEDEPGQPVRLVEPGGDKLLERGVTRGIGRCRDGPELLGQAGLAFRSLLLHLYRRMTHRLHSIFVPQATSESALPTRCGRWRR